MLQALVQLSLRFRGIVVALACVLAGYGIAVAQRAKLDVFPDFVPPQVAIQTEAPGLSPEQVELLVTRPIETGAQRARRARVAALGVDPGTLDRDRGLPRGQRRLRARQLLAEQLAELAGQLPAGVARAAHDAAHVVDDGPAQDRPRLGAALADASCGPSPTGR